MQNEFLRLIKAESDSPAVHGGVLKAVKQRLRLGIKEVKERKIFNEQQAERRAGFKDSGIEELSEAAASALMSSLSATFPSAALVLEVGGRTSVRRRTRM